MFLHLSVVHMLCWDHFEFVGLVHAMTSGCPGLFIVVAMNPMTTNLSCFCELKEKDSTYLCCSIVYDRILCYTS